MQIPDVSGRGLAGPSSASGGGPRLGLAQPGLPEAPGLGGRGRRRAREEAGEEEGAGRCRGGICELGKSAGAAEERCVCLGAQGGHLDGTYLDPQLDTWASPQPTLGRWFSVYAARPGDSCWGATEAFTALYSCNQLHPVQEVSRGTRESPAGGRIRIGVGTDRAPTLGAHCPALSGSRHLGRRGRERKREY